MDINRKYTSQNIPPAQLWIGQHAQAIEEINNFLQKILCKNNNCNVCPCCIQIANQQHHAIMWLYPEKNYTLDQFDSLFEKLSLKLHPNEFFFFIIQKADYLTPACANKLLKPMEEPPSGYHFILLAEQANLLLPTIRSRCVEYLLKSSTSAQITHPLYESFTKKLASSYQFSKIMDGINFNERESKELLDAILHHWFILYQQKKINSDDKKLAWTSFITTLENTYLCLPMPGSTITFWRNLYLKSYENLSILLI